VYEENEDQEDLIQVYKKLSKPAKKELMKIRDTSYPHLFDDIKLDKRDLR
jgi:hypothetical protein